MGLRDAKIAQLKEHLSDLEKREKELRTLINFPLTSSQRRESATFELTLILDEAWQADTELERLEAQ